MTTTKEAKSSGERRLPIPREQVTLTGRGGENKGGSIEGTLNKREDSPDRVCVGGYQHHETLLGYSIPCLPEDIWRHIHYLMPMRDAARAACVSHTFLNFWRCHPNLTLDWKTLCKPSSWRNFTCRVDSILRNHSGIGIKTVKLHLSDDSSTHPYVEGWLEAALRPGIEELTLTLYKKYNFPCSLLSDGVRNSIRYLQLDSCCFHPTVELGPLRSLTNLCLYFVSITTTELDCLLSNSLALEKLHLCDCRKVTFLEIPCVLLQLSSLSVLSCKRLEVIEIKAPNLSHLNIEGDMKISIEEASQMKIFSLCCTNSIGYARAELPSTMPNLETLELMSHDKVVNAPMLSTKFLYLRHLTIYMTPAVAFSPSYDYFSLISFLDVSPSLETLLLDVSHRQMEHEAVFDGSAPLRQLPERCHYCIKSVEIIGFSSVRSLVELTCCIVKNAGSLEHLVLNILPRHVRCSGKNGIPCLPISKTLLEEAFRTIGVIRTYIAEEVPPTAKLTVKKPCTRCRSLG